MTDKEEIEHLRARVATLEQNADDFQQQLNEIAGKVGVAARQRQRSVRQRLA